MAGVSTFKTKQLENFFVVTYIFCSTCFDIQLQLIIDLNIDNESKHNSCFLYNETKNNEREKIE